MFVVALGGVVMATVKTAAEDFVDTNQALIRAGRNERADIHDFPNLHLKIDDGRNHLLLSNQKYDVITADVIHPRNAGSALLYSYEYYKLARDSLKPGGIMVVAVPGVGPWTSAEVVQRSHGAADAVTVDWITGRHQWARETRRSVSAGISAGGSWKPTKTRVRSPSGAG